MNVARLESFAASVVENAGGPSNSDMFQSEWLWLLEFIREWVNECREDRVEEWHRLANSDNRGVARRTQRRLERLAKRRARKEDSATAAAMIAAFVAAPYDEVVAALEG